MSHVIAIYCTNTSEEGFVIAAIESGTSLVFQTIFGGCFIVDGYASNRVDIVPSSDALAKMFRISNNPYTIVGFSIMGDVSIVVKSAA